MEPEPTLPDALLEEEPRYLRRQKPIEIKRRRFGRRARGAFRRAALGTIGAAAGGWTLYATAHFLLFSPRMVLSGPERIELRGNHYVSRAAVLEVFAADRGRSLLRVPLAARRRALEQIPWVEQAAVRRVLPNRLQVELVERTPVAFLRAGADLALVDAHGMILERPPEGSFAFPVVSGLSEQMPGEERERVMALFVEFLKEIEQVRTGASRQVSEVDLSDARDLRATLAVPQGGTEADGQGPVLAHFGDGNFENRFRTLSENVAQWRAAAGRVDSVDLRFDREVVVNPRGP